ncbi:MAG: DUF4160 domain-containing protein [Acidobacteriota bacterium]
MPEISRFYGMIILMFYNDHAPPHFHVRHAADRAIVGIESLRLLEGRLSPRALRMVLEWAALHQSELLEDWQRARSQEPLSAIEPLE